MPLCAKEMPMQLQVSMITIGTSLVNKFQGANPELNFSVKDVRRGSMGNSRTRCSECAIHVMRTPFTMSRTSIVLNPQIPNVHADTGRFEYQRGEAIKVLLCGGTAVQDNAAEDL